MRKKTRVKCFATGLALAVALSTSGTGLYGGIPQVSAAIWQAGEKQTTNSIVCGEEESWDSAETKASVSYAGTKKQLAKGTLLTYKMTISEEEYQSLGEGYLKVQAVIQQEETWNEETVLKMGWPMYYQEDFTQNEDGTWTTTVEFEVTKEIEIFHSLLIDVVGTLFDGDIDITDVALNDPNESWSAEGTVTNEVTFGDAEDWDTWDNTLRATFDGNQEKVEAGTEMSFVMTISAAAYATMGETDYIKLQAVLFQEADNWDTVEKLGWPMFAPADFTENEDGTYSAKVKMTVKTGIDTFHSLLIQGVGTGFSGSVAISELSFVKKAEDPVLTPQDPTVLADFATGIEGWAGEAGYDYSHGNAASEKKEEAAEAEWDEASQSLKMIVDYSKDTASSWSEAKIKGTFTPVSVANYNLVTFTLRYPSSMETVRTKFFMSDTTGNTEVLNGEGSFRTKTVTDLGNGWSTVTIRGEFTPKDVEVDNLTIGIVGPYADLACVYIDDVKLGQLDASEDYVVITETVKETADKADLTGMASDVKLVDGNATDEAKALAAYLMGLQSSGQVLFGHQNSTFRSVRDNGVTSDVKDVTGSEAGLFGIDTLALAGIETSQTTRQDALDASIAASVKAYNGGSIVSLSCHMPNFTNNKITETGDENYPYDFTKCDFSESQDLTPCSDYILEGGEYNPQYNAYLDIIADYALALQEKGIPVLFRPFHENSGGWFWWGTSTSVESYQAIWRYMVNYLEEKGVHNFLYVYSPNGPISSKAEYLERYPGDAYVDVLGFDYYDDYADADVYTGDVFFEALAGSCDIVAGLADEKGKIPAIAETGIRITGAGKDSLMVTGNPTTGKDWYNKLVNTASSHGIPYFLLWANFDSANFFIPYKFNDTMGQEMINEFISSYNNEKSVFGNGTNFYVSGESGAADAAISKADSITLSGYSEEVTGYMISPKNYAVIKEPFEMKASVKNAENVEFRIQTAEGKEAVTVSASAQGSIYTGVLTKEILAALGETSTGIVTLVADGQQLGQARFINFNKDADVMPQKVFDNFEYYYGNNGLLQSKYGSHNSASNCSSSMTLDSENKVQGDYSGVFNYKLTYKGSEVWTGGLGRVLDADKTDFSKYNAISMWVKPDGNGQKLVLQLNDNYEAYLTDFVKGEQAQYVTIPFSKFIKKGGTAAVDPSAIKSFKIWCNSVPDNYKGDKDESGNYTVEGKIYFDDIKAVKISEEDLAKTDANGLIISDKPLTDLLESTKPEEPEKPGPQEPQEPTPGPGTTNPPTEQVPPTTQDPVTGEQGPDIEAAKASTSNITLSWKANDKAAGYYVYIYDNSKKKYVKAADTAKPTAKVSKISGKKLKAATEYKFKVTAYQITDGNKVEIADSTFLLTTATAPKKVSFSSLKKKGTNKAVLKWKKVSGASGYEIYMKTGSKGKYKLVKTIKKGKTVSYTKTKLKKKTKYYFKVRSFKSVSGKKVYGAYSRTRSIKLK